MPGCAHTTPQLRAMRLTGEMSSKQIACVCMRKLRDQNPRLQIIETTCPPLSALRDGLCNPPPPLQPTIVVIQDHVHSYATALTPHLFLCIDPLIHAHKSVLFLTKKHMRVFKEGSTDSRNVHPDESHSSKPVFLQLVITWWVWAALTHPSKNLSAGLLSIWFPSFLSSIEPYMETSVFIMFLHLNVQIFRLIWPVGDHIGLEVVRWLWVSSIPCTMKLSIHRCLPTGRE